MANKVNYDGKTLLNIKFSPKQKGYDPLEVDQIFDNIIKDYEAMSASISSLTSMNEQLQSKIADLKKEVAKEKLQIATLKEQLDALKKTSNVTEDNYELVKKVAAYERVLHRKGVNLKKAISDPDNC